MLLKHYLERGVSKAELSRRFGVSRRTIHEWVETGQLDRDLSSAGPCYSSRPPVPHKLDPYTGVISMHVSRSIPGCRRSGCLTGPRGGLPRWLQPGAGLRPRGASTGADRVGGAVRDAGGASGPGGLRDLHPALGPPPRPGGGAEPLPAAVAVLLQGLGSRARIRWVDLVTRPIRTPCGSAASARPRRPSPSIAPVPCGAHA